MPTADRPSRNGKLDVGGVVGSGILHVIKEVGMELPTTGTVPLDTGEIAEDIASYLLNSEQIASAVSLGVFVKPGNVVTAAGGYMIQFHAEIPDDLIDHIEQSLAEVPTATTMIQQGCGPEEMLEQALGRLPVDVVRHLTPTWDCHCSRRRVEQALVAMGEEELRGLMDEEETTEVRCDFCTATYFFQRHELEVVIAEALDDTENQ